MNTTLGDKLLNLAGIGVLLIALILEFNPTSANGVSCGRLGTIARTEACVAAREGRTLLAGVLIVVSVFLWIAAMMVRRVDKQQMNDGPGRPSPLRLDDATSDE